MKRTWALSNVRVLERGAIGLEASSHTEMLTTFELQSGTPLERLVLADGRLRYQKLSVGYLAGIWVEPRVL